MTSEVHERATSKASRRPRSRPEGSVQKPALSASTLMPEPAIETAIARGFLKHLRDY